MEKNIKIVGTEIYYPENKITEDYFLKKFDEKDIEIKGLLKSLGKKDVRRIKRNEENVITMSVKVAKKALKKAKLEPTDIDMLIFTTDQPEYFQPSNSLIFT